MNIFAHSWGAMPGARYALKNPDQVSKLIVIGPIPLRSDPYHEYFFPRVMVWMDSTTVLQVNKLMEAFQNPQDNEDIRSIGHDFFELFKRGYFYDPHVLACNELTISEVAWRVGFGNPSWFAQCFIRNLT